MAPHERLRADVHHADVPGRIDVAEISGALGHALIVVG
jgi:hypothetical protein